MYDPFVPGRFTVAERSMQAFDSVRNRSFPCDMWRPTEPVGVCPIILLSHSSGESGPRGYTFLTNHLASHGYIVAGLNHSELVARELERREGETPEQRAARAEAAIASRAPDIRFLLDYPPSGGGQRRLPSAGRHVRDLRQNTRRETHGRSSPRRPHAFHGRCRAAARSGADLAKTPQSDYTGGWR
jgi:hypothetical protein